MDALLGLTRRELRELSLSEGGNPYRGEQLADCLYRRGAHSLVDMETLPRSLRESLSHRYRIGRSRVIATTRGGEETVKLLLELHDGARVESVGLPYTDRLSCCVSTQVGCPVGCVFCATGLSGYVRNLGAGEIVDQVLTVQDSFRTPGSQAHAADRRVDHVTFMGMGEPLLNYEAAIKALRLLNSELGISMRKMTLSTAGYVPGIERLRHENLQVTLAVSLHAPMDDLRARLMPGTTRWRITEVIAACREYVRTTGRRVTFEYCLIDGVNDGVRVADELAALLRGMNCHVNLIPFNPVRGLVFRRPMRQQVRAFRSVLEAAGIQVTQRIQRGSGINAACGQLRRNAGDARP